jgi:aminoglycoside phosphotransferase (APT) family kinase protein
VSEDFASLVARFVRRVLGGTAEPQNLHRLTGGANMESWSFDYAGQGYVLRRSSSAELMAGRAYGHDVEAAIVRTAYAAGVKAPEIVGEIQDADDLGTGYLMRRVEAEVAPAKILAAPPPSLLHDLACELAKIHALPLEGLPDLPSPDAAMLLADLKAKFIEYGGDRPVMALAFRWLEDQMPPPVQSVLLHGDYRMGNIMADERGLAAILDWELAHLGDRHQDLAFGCINSWRFGHIERPAFGVGALADFWAAYEAECGIPVDAARFRYWLVYSTLWWGICCLQMAEIWRSGLDAGLERAVIGRRASETEVDLLMLLEEGAPEQQKHRHPELVSGSISPVEPEGKAEKWMLKQVQHDGMGMTGEPSAVELLGAVSAWIETDVKPRAKGRDRFMASVALNALGMLQREAAQPVELHDKVLADDLLAGRQSLVTPGLLAKLKAQSLAKLAADQPKYSALAAATKKWSI